MPQGPLDDSQQMLKDIQDMRKAMEESKVYGPMFLMFYSEVEHRALCEELGVEFSPTSFGGYNVSYLQREQEIQ